MRKFTRKSYGRIYVDQFAHIDLVKKIIKQMDIFEYEYLPDDLITIIENYPKVVYTHKFDALDLDALTIICYKYGIYIWVFDAGQDEFPVDVTGTYNINIVKNKKVKKDE